MQELTFILSSLIQRQCERFGFIATSSPLPLVGEGQGVRAGCITKPPSSPTLLPHAGEGSKQLDYLYQLILRHRVWHQIFTTFSQDENFQNNPIYNRLAKHCEKDTFRLLNIMAETVKLTEILNHNNIQHCFIKGVVLNEMLYGKLKTRPCKDIDLWVEEAHYENAVAHLFALGYQQQLPDYPLSGFKKRYYMSYFHDIAFYHPTRAILVELHFRLDHDGLNFFTPTRNRCQSVLLGNIPVTTLKDDYHLLYLIVHGALHAWVRLRWLNDIAHYVYSKRCSLSQVMTLAKEIHCEDLVVQAFLLIRDLFKVENQELNTILLHPSQRAQWLTKAAKHFIRMDKEAPHAPLFSKDYLYYRLYRIRVMTTKQGRISSIIRSLFKIDGLFPYVTFPAPLHFMYYVLYPFWLIKHFSQRR